MLDSFWGIDKAVLTKVIITFLIIVVLWLVRKILIKLFLDKLDDAVVRYRWRKIVLYLLVFIGFILIIPLWFGAFGSLSTYLGLLSAGIAISLKDLIINFVGWTFIVLRKPFKVGDRIQLGEVKGDVIDIRVFQFSLMEIGGWVHSEQSTGRIMHVPNGIIFSQPQANYTAGFEYIWHEIPVLITFESNWEKAKKILHEVLGRNALHLSPNAEEQIKEAATRYLIYYNKLSPIIYTSVKDSGIELTLRFLCDPRKRRDTEELVWEDILTQFSKNDDIDFAYPTQRFYNNMNEGKSRAKQEEKTSNFNNELRKTDEKI